MTKEIVYKRERIFVSDNGEIIWNGKIRKPYINADGYPVVSINTNDGWRSIGVARLVATAFVSNPNNNTEVHHIDYDRTNYSVDNLVWVSHDENVKLSKINKPNFTGENNPNYGNRKLSKFYKEHPEIAKVKQGRPGKQNGRYVHGMYVSESL